MSIRLLDYIVPSLYRRKYPGDDLLISSSLNKDLGYLCIRNGFNIIGSKIGFRKAKKLISIKKDEPEFTAFEGRISEFLEWLYFLRDPPKVRDYPEYARKHVYREHDPTKHKWHEELKKMIKYGSSIFLGLKFEKEPEVLEEVRYKNILEKVIGASDLLIIIDGKSYVIETKIIKKGSGTYGIRALEKLLAKGPQQLKTIAKFSYVNFGELPTLFFVTSSPGALISNKYRYNPKEDKLEAIIKNENI